MEPTPISKAKKATQQKVFDLIRKHSFQFGDFILASGAHSTYYLDMKPTMFHPEAVAALAELIIDRIGPLKPDFIGGMELGAVPLIAPVVMYAREQRGWRLPGFFVRKKPKEHGTKRLVEGVIPGELRDKRVVILDDVTTTGDSVMEAVKAARKEGANVVLVLSLVDREAGARELFAREGIQFDSLFSVGAFLNAAKAEAVLS